jgi:hypothetical protein
MTRKARWVSTLLIALALTLLMLVPLTAQASPAVEMQVAFVIDGSGSIDTSEWALMVDATAAMIEDPDCIPRNSTVELCIIQFAGSTASLEVSPTVIDSQATAEDIADDVRDIVKRGSWTPTGEGIKMAKEQITGSANFATADRQIINLVTNGHPEPDEQPAIAIAERDAAVAAGIDEIDSEAIGVEQVWLEWLRDNIVYPELGVIAPPYPDPRGSAGFVRPVDTFDDFAEALEEKCAVIFPHLTLAPATATNYVDETHTVVATHTQNGDPVVGETINFEVTSGPNAGMTGTGITDSNGEATWSYSGTTVGTDTIAAVTQDGLPSDPIEVEKIWRERPVVPGVTVWGIAATVAALGILAPLLLRRRMLNR